MMPADIVRVLYGVRPAPADARRCVERLIQEFGNAAVSEAARITWREIGPTPADHRTPLIYLDAHLRVAAARRARSAS